MADFTELYKQTGSLCKISPSGEYIASALEHRLVIRHAETMQVVVMYSCQANIEDLGWAPDSNLVYCASFQLGNIQIFSVRDESWTAHIDEGLCGTVALKWCPDARHLLSFSEFNVNLVGLLSMK